METAAVPTIEHPFVRAPHRTLVRLSIPVLLSLIAEPLMGMADTAFVARLGAPALAALGVGTVVMSGAFWIFNFLGIATQTEVARADGAAEPERGREVTGLALLLGLAAGTAMFLAGLRAVPAVAAAMGAQGAVRSGAELYLGIRLLGAPAVLVTLTAFGALRGLQDMKTPLKVALGINALNLILDPLMIFGAGPVPALGIGGAAWATVASQWVGGFWSLAAVRARVGLPKRLHGRDARCLLVVGGDLFLRTGLLTAFLLLTTRAATRLGAPAGAAHQAIRQVWVFTALVLDAYAAAAQSLIGYFRGAGRVGSMRHVAWVACLWSVGTGTALAAAMLLAEAPVARLLVPPDARALFATAWMVAALTQPLNALSFATDGIHWGTADYRFLRNVMGLATAVGVAGILLGESSGGGLLWIWGTTGVWIGVRAVFGVARVWPGIGRSPFR